MRKAYVSNPNLKEGETTGFGGNQKGKIIGMFTIGNSSTSINNVWLVDGLKHNLLTLVNFVVVVMKLF